MEVSKIALIWVLVFLVTVYALQGSPYLTVSMLILLIPTASLSLYIAKVRKTIVVITSLVLLIYLLAISAFKGLENSALAPSYLPVSISLIAIYIYSYIRLRRIKAQRY